MRRVVDWQKMGFVETLIHLKTPSLPLLSSVHRALGGLSYSNIVPVNRYVYLIILCLYVICIVSHSLYKHVYVSADCSIEKGNSAILLHLIELKKGCILQGKKQMEKETLNKIKIVKNLFRFLTGWMLISGISW